MTHNMLKTFILVAIAALLPGTAVAQAPVVASVVNSASFEPLLAPGTGASIFGEGLAAESCSFQELPLPKELCGVRVLVGEDEAALSNVSPTQLAIQIPVEAEPGETTLVVELDGNPSEPFPITLETHAPGLLSRDASGSGLGLFTVAAGPPVDFETPADPGAFLTAFGVGLGATEPPLATGEAAGFGPLHQTVETPIVSLGCLTPEVFASVLLPGVPGFYQVVFPVPETAPGGNHGLSLTIGGQTSNEVVLPVSGDAIPGVCAVVNPAFSI